MKTISVFYKKVYIALSPFCNLTCRFSMLKSYNAAVLVIGNEILSGRTVDQNVNFLAKRLGEMGIKLMEVRFIPDIEQTIITAINELRKTFTYVFTTGGIGPTHDDITTECVAKAFGVPLIQDTDARNRLQSHYKETQLNDARLKMALVPKDAILIDNSVSAAPGYKIENVFVFAGIPRIMQAMFEAAIPFLHGGAIIHSIEIRDYVSESQIAGTLASVQQQNPSVEIGSYPFTEKDGRYGVSIVLRSTDKVKLAELEKILRPLIKTQS